MIPIMGIWNVESGNEILERERERWGEGSKRSDQDLAKATEKKGDQEGKICNVEVCQVFKP